MNSNTKTPTSTGMPLDLARADQHGVRAARVPARRPQPVRVALGILEPQRVDAFDRRVGLGEAARVEHELQPPRRRHREMVLALRADAVVLVEVSRQQRSPAARALGEHARRDAALLLRKHVVVVFPLVPGHEPLSGAGEYHRPAGFRGAVDAEHDRKSLVHFGVWHPISQAGTAAPEAAGVLQTRAEGVMDYRSGRSAMVLYACSGAGRDPARLRGGPRRARAGPRHLGGRALDPVRRRRPSPRRELDRLLEGFVERFGSPPISNSAERRAAAPPRNASEEEDPR